MDKPYNVINTVTPYIVNHTGKNLTLSFIQGHYRSYREQTLHCHSYSNTPYIIIHTETNLTLSFIQRLTLHCHSYSNTPYIFIHTETNLTLSFIQGQTLHCHLLCDKPYIVIHAGTNLTLLFKQVLCWFGLMLNVPVSIFSVMLGRSHRFLGITSTFGGVIMSYSRTQHKT